MDLYNEVSYKISRLVAENYSTSFSSSIKLFAEQLRPHINAIYGLVRLADEIVDSYRGPDSSKILKDLEDEVYSALARGYSSNPIVQSFILTSRKYSIDKSLISPFFDSMRMDLKPLAYKTSDYEKYIYGSAEVVGLMCLRVFVEDNDKLYNKLETGARSLGSAYQKVNFLRDIGSDNSDLGRIYFPGIDFESFDDTAKSRIIQDIEKEFRVAERAVALLPPSSRQAVQLSVRYYSELLKKIKRTPASVIKKRRVRVNNLTKIVLLIGLKLKSRDSHD